MVKMSIVGINYQGVKLALFVQDIDLPRVPEVYGMEPIWIEPVPEEVEGCTGRISAFMERCRQKHWEGVAA